MIDAPFPHTDFNKMAHKFYLRTIGDNLKPQQEEKTQAAWREDITSYSRDNGVPNGVRGPVFMVYFAFEALPGQHSSRQH